MLPSHLMDPTKKKNERLSHTRLGQAPPAPLPSLCVTGAMCQQGRMETVSGDVNERVTLAYCVFRPRQLHSSEKPPLVVLHGGPSIPSNYLLPIVNGVTDRAIVFYDQWGCGKSSRPSKSTKTPFSISTMVQHLGQLLRKQWKLNAYHLLGHSFGGILAYEYLLQLQEAERGTIGGCQSLILASTPTSASLIQEESRRLYRDIAGMDENDMDEEDDTLSKKRYDEIFRQTHECRLVQTPLALMDALAQAGPISWRGIPAIADYEAPATAAHQTKFLPTLVLTGEYDFCTDQCVAGWKERILDPPPKYKILTNCSHYGMLEDERQYGNAILAFLLQQDKTTPKVTKGE